MIRFDPGLPISSRVDDITTAIRDHRVVIVAGETGSGKTTQLPKICLTLGLQRIAHTQPRRLAARSVAERIAEEMEVALGDQVGYQVRFTRKAHRETQLLVMTDGVLLAEISHDRDLRRYDCIIVDEAHERSLNIDFLLGYLKQLLVRRPELKVIITSATIDTARFSAHFDDAPIIEVSGRTYPVEIRYRPIIADEARDEAAASTPVVAEPRDQIDAICDAITELRTLGSGDILVFLSGEREIRDAAEAVSAMKLPHTEVLPLYARLSAADQHRVFAGHTESRVVLATNVAETSITVPGIRSVIDAGTARISRYSTRTKVQRLPIEPVSQASANQRAGRCGRVAPGVCIRLYSETDFAARPEFTEPEILRTNLASVILQMAHADLGDIASFPFVERPDSSQITDGLRLLAELNALKPSRIGPATPGSRPGSPQLTRIGHQLSRIPLDPRMARMLIEADKQDCLREVMVIVAGLTIQDPRERPTESREQADALHRRFWGPLPEDSPDGAAEESVRDNSDFLALLRLWQYVTDRREELSGNAFRRLCREECLNFLRIREWQDLVGQLRTITRELKFTRNSAAADPARIHTAILSGLLSHVGLAEIEDTPRAAGGKRRRPGPREYRGARGSRFAVNPGSALAKSQPDLVMAAELVETTRLWGRTVAGIEAAWVEEVGEHLLRRTHSEPHWSARSGSVVATEKVTLLGVPIIAGRSVNYARIDPVSSREIFIRSALVEGDWRTRHHFFARNAETRRRAEELEERARRRDIVVDDQALYEFYDARIPAEVISATHFDTWWRQKRSEDDSYLDLTLDDLVHDDAGPRTGDFPDTWQVGTATLPVSYVFDPGSGADGVSVEIQLAQLNQIPAEPFTWQVPGLRRELATELIRTLPKAIRTRFVPAPNHAGRVLEWLAEHEDTHDVAFPQALARALHQLTGEQVPPGAWALDRLDDHLRVTFVVRDAGRDNREVGRGKDLDELRRRFAPQLTAKLTRAAAKPGRTRATTWTFGTLPEQQQVGGGVGYPGLVDAGTAVDLVVHDNPGVRDRRHRLGLRRLVQLNTPDPTKWVIAHLSNTDKLALAHSPYPGVPELLADARLKAVGDLIDAAGGWRTRTEAAFTELRDTVRADLPDRMRSVVATTAEILRTSQRIDLALAGVGDAEIRDDITEQRDTLVFSGFLAATGEPWFGELPRYLRAIELRLIARRGNQRRDDEALGVIWPLEQQYAELCARLPPGPVPEPVAELGWLLEELRVSLFAQSLGTVRPVSAKRLRTALEDVEQYIGRHA